MMCQMCNILVKLVSKYGCIEISNLNEIWYRPGTMVVMPER